MDISFDSTRVVSYPINIGDLVLKYCEVSLFKGKHKMLLLLCILSAHPRPVYYKLITEIGKKWK